MIKFNKNGEIHGFANFYLFGIKYKGYYKNGFMVGFWEEFDCSTRLTETKFYL